MNKTMFVWIALTAFAGGGGFAQETTRATKSKKKATGEMTPEQRRNMASMHEKMAACLRSEKPTSECRSEMKKGCQEMMGGNGCPMMGERGGMMGNGMTHDGGMMNGEGKSSSH